MLGLHQMIYLAAVLCALCLVDSDAQRVKGSCTTELFGKWWQDENTPCSKEYEVCRSFVWRKNRCVLGHFNYATGLCQRFNDGSGCVNTDNQIYFPNLGRKKRDTKEIEHVNVLTNATVESRHKRQANNCPPLPTGTSYWCPTNVNQVAIFPNWSDCTSFYLCMGGQLELGRCSNQGQSYVFYNPRLMSCEQYPGLTNTCVWLSSADYKPFTGTI